MDLKAYLERIGYTGDIAPTLETLRGMHLAHFYSVPFENLDISRGTRIQVREDVFFDKVVRRRRGGFCLELSGMFATALREIGFDVDVIGARVITNGMSPVSQPAAPDPSRMVSEAPGQLSEPMSHMTLVVHLDEDWIADVGFGGRIAQPLRMAERGAQFAEGRVYVVANDGDHWMVTCSEEGNPPPMSYLFAAVPRGFEEFDGVCHWLQTSPSSRFTLGDLASMATRNGRVTVAGDRLIEIVDGVRTEREVAEGERAGILRERFGIELG